MYESALRQVSFLLSNNSGLLLLLLMLLTKLGRQAKKSELSPRTLSSAINTLYKMGRLLKVHIPPQNVTPPLLSVDPHLEGLPLFELLPRRQVHKTAA